MIKLLSCSIDLKMKLYSIVIVLILINCAKVAFADENKDVNVDEWEPQSSDDIKNVRNECLKEHQLSEEQKTHMKDFNFPDEEEVRQYLLCTALKMQVFDPEKGGYFPERIAKQFKMHMNETEVLEIAKACADSNEVGSPVDVWAFRGHKCLMTSKIGDEVRNYLKKKREEAAKQEAA